MKKARKISDAEWEVMSVIWSKSPVSAREIIEDVGPKKNWQPRTIRTLLDRLVRKGILQTTEEGRRYLYRPKVTLESCVRKESESFLDRVFGGEPASMLINLVKHTKLSPAQIRELQHILSTKEK